MTAIRMALRDRAFLIACLYLGGLFVSIFTLGWLIIIGGNPLRIENVGMLAATGYRWDSFRAGDIAGARRSICSDTDVALEFFPSLVDSRGYRFPLPSGMVEMAKGCHQTTYGFIVPDLPPGEYSYSATVRYQNNLVGRDESATYPPMRVRIIR